MGVEQLQVGINIFAVFMAVTVFTAIITNYIEKIIAARKVTMFLVHFVPAITLFMASSSNEVCRIIGSFLGTTETIGFYVLLMFGFMFFGNVIILGWSTFTGKKVFNRSQNQR